MTVDRLAEMTMTAKRRLPNLLITLVARPAVRSVAGRGTVALMRGMFAWHLTIMPDSWSVGRSVGWSVGRSVGRSVGQSDKLENAVDIKKRTVCLSKRTKGDKELIIIKINYI